MHGACLIVINAMAMLQVLSAKQVGIWQLHMYPWISSIETALDALAAERGAASKQDIASEVTADSMTKEWEAFEKYVDYVVANDPHAYVPLLEHQEQWGQQRTRRSNSWYYSQSWCVLTNKTWA